MPLFIPFIFLSPIWRTAPCCGTSIIVPYTQFYQAAHPPQSHEFFWLLWLWAVMSSKTGGPLLSRANPSHCLQPGNNSSPASGSQDVTWALAQLRHKLHDAYSSPHGDSAESDAFWRTQASWEDAAILGVIHHKEIIYWQNANLHSIYGTPHELVLYNQPHRTALSTLNSLLTALEFLRYSGYFPSSN